MANLHKYLKRHSIAEQAAQKVLGEKTYDAVHFIGTPAVQQQQAKQDAKNAADAAANRPVLPLPDEEELARQARRRNSARGGGRASTIFTQGDQLGP